MAYKAREAKSFVETELDGTRSRVYTDKAIRLTRALNIAALAAAELAANGASEEELLDNFAELESLFYQIDSTKRSLARSLRSKRKDIEDTFNQIREAFFVYKKALTGTYR